MSTLLHQILLLLFLTDTKCVVFGAISESLCTNCSAVLDLKSLKTDVANMMANIIAMNSKLDKQAKCQEELTQLGKRIQDHDDRLKSHDQLNCKEHMPSQGSNCAQSGPRDCSDIRAMGFTVSGVYGIYPGNDGKRIQAGVYCDFNSFNESWLVFQRRKDGSENFERLYKEYERGFGNLSGEFWLGNEMLSLLTMNRKYKLRVELEDFTGEKRYAEYLIFSVKPETDKYQLIARGYSGNAGDSLGWHDGMKFSTTDADNDADSGNCAQQFHGGWWFNDCLTSNLNGLYLRGSHTSYADGVNWHKFRGQNYSLKTTEMKIAAVI